jgi:hypothetical protein
MPDIVRRNRNDAALNPFTTGEETFPRVCVSSQATMTSQTLRLGYFTARKSFTVASMRFCTAGTAAGATPTLIRYGLYQAAANGDLTLVASTANDTALLAAQNTAYPKALSVAFPLVQGTRYAAGLLVVTGAAAPIVPAVAIGAAEGLIAPRLQGTLAAQADLPLSIVDATFTTLSTTAVVGALLP